MPFRVVSQSYFTGSNDRVFIDFIITYTPSSLSHWIFAALGTVWISARWTYVARELHQTMRELAAGGCLLTVFYADVVFCPHRGSSCLLQFACWAAQIFLNLYLEECLVGITIVPVTETVLRVIIDTYF